VHITTIRHPNTADRVLFVLQSLGYAMVVVFVVVVVVVIVSVDESML